MSTEMIAVIACTAVSLATLMMVILLFMRSRRAGADDAQLREIAALRQDLSVQLSAMRVELSGLVGQNIKTLSDVLSDTQKTSAATQTTMMDKRLHDMREQLEQVRLTMERRLTAMLESNEQRLAQMNETVNEKLQKTLDERLGHTFKLVNERLQEVYKGLGEMQTLASSVGDLKKVLSNVKTRGIVGEVQLGAILEEILSPEQYEMNVKTKPGSNDMVEYAVRLPGDGDTPVYLPIDAKFPADAYSNLVDAYESGQSELIAAATAELTRRIKQSAKDIRDKYIDPPHTTDFAILFLPFEGLYAEVLRLSLVEELQRVYRINIAGPTTMAAILNSLQMGFRTLAIQKRSSEVWQILGAVRTEFDNFASVLDKTQRKLDEANRELDKLVGVRTRQIQRKLKNVTALPESDAQVLLDTPAGDLDDSIGAADDE